MKKLPIPADFPSLTVDIEKDWMPRDKGGLYASPFVARPDLVGDKKEKCDPCGSSPKASVLLRMPSRPILNFNMPMPPYLGAVGDIDPPVMIPWGDPKESFEEWYVYLANAYGRIGGQINHTIGLLMSAYLYFFLVSGVKPRHKISRGFFNEKDIEKLLASGEPGYSIYVEAFKELGKKKKKKKRKVKELQEEFKKTTIYKTLQIRLKENFSNLALLTGHDPLSGVWPPPYGYVTFALSLNGMVGKLTYSTDILSKRVLALGSKKIECKPIHEKPKKRGLVIQKMESGKVIERLDPDDWPQRDVFEEDGARQQMAQCRVLDPSRPGSYMTYGMLTGFILELQKFDPDPSSSSNYHVPPPPPV